MSESWDCVFHTSLWLSQPSQRASSKRHSITHLGPRHKWESKVATMTFFQTARHGKGVRFNRNQKRMDAQKQKDLPASRENGM